MLGLLILVCIATAASLLSGIYLIFFKKCIEGFAIFLIFIGVFLCVPTYLCVDTYLQPHHGESPTLDDVPTEAYVDTLRTISSSGKETVAYKVRWNDDRDNLK